MRGIPVRTEGYLVHNCNAAPFCCSITILFGQCRTVSFGCACAAVARGFVEAVLLVCCSSQRKPRETPVGPASWEGVPYGAEEG